MSHDETDYGICDVCGQERAVGVASSITGPVSFAYCRKCLAQNREPYGALVAGAFGSENKEDLADWYLPYVYGTLETEDKTMEEFLADVRKATEEYRTAMSGKAQPREDD